MSASSFDAEDAGISASGNERKYVYNVEPAYEALQLPQS